MPDKLFQSYCIIGSIIGCGILVILALILVPQGHAQEDIRAFCFSNCLNDEDPRHNHCNVSYDQYPCANPKTLSPELRKAYFELKALLKDESGVTVRIQ